MALDESKEDDEVVEIEGFKFCIEKALLENIGGASIDISYMGFVIEPDNAPSAPESSCSTCGSGGSCGI